MTDQGNATAAPQLSAPSGIRTYQHLLDWMSTNGFTYREFDHIIRYPGGSYTERHLEISGHGHQDSYNRDLCQRYPETAAAELWTCGRIPGWQKQKSDALRSPPMLEQLNQLEYDLETSGYYVRIANRQNPPYVLEIKHGKEVFRPIMKTPDDAARIASEIQRRGWPWSPDPQPIKGRNIFRCADCDRFAVCPFVDSDRDNAPICRDCYDREQERNA